MSMSEHVLTYTLVSIVATLFLSFTFFNLSTTFRLLRLPNCRVSFERERENERERERNIQWDYVITN